MHGWQFECPSCKRIQNVTEFKQFEDMGANPNSVYQKCLGRFTGGKSGPHKCDWAAFGLFSGPDFVVMPDGTKTPVFEFANLMASTDKASLKGD